MAAQWQVQYARGFVLVMRVVLATMIFMLVTFFVAAPVMSLFFDTGWGFRADLVLFGMAGSVGLGLLWLATPAITKALLELL